jgi:hypothetical protein
MVGVSEKGMVTCKIEPRDSGACHCFGFNVDIWRLFPAFQKILNLDCKSSENQQQWLTALLEHVIAAGTAAQFQKPRRCIYAIRQFHYSNGAHHLQIFFQIV